MTKPTAGARVPADDGQNLAYKFRHGYPAGSILVRRPAFHMTRRKMFLGAVLAILGLPLVLGLIAAASIYVFDETNGMIVSSGHERKYLLHVPKSYDRAKPAPLVISMHGAGAWPAHQMNASRWNRLADEHGFIVVYPSGADFIPRIWPMGGSEGNDDVRFISDLIDKLQGAYNIDPTRIYADGLSNGGGMAFALSCKLSDRIAAVGAVAAAQLLPFGWCKDPRAVPMIAFHGTADPVVPYKGGRTWKAPAPTPYPDVSEWVANWARRNQCEPRPVESAVAAHAVRREYTSCAQDAAVVLYTIDGGGHTWPGGKPQAEWWNGPNTSEVDATALMWAFFLKHPLRNK